VHVDDIKRLRVKSVFLNFFAESEKTLGEEILRREPVGLLSVKSSSPRVFFFALGEEILCREHIFLLSPKRSSPRARSRRRILLSAKTRFPVVGSRPGTAPTPWTPLLLDHKTTKLLPREIKQVIRALEQVIISFVCDGLITVLAGVLILEPQD
jgi:hypothetical protein